MIKISMFNKRRIYEVAFSINAPAFNEENSVWKRSKQQLY